MQTKKSETALWYACRIYVRKPCLPLGSNMDRNTRSNWTKAAPQESEKEGKKKRREEMERCWLAFRRNMGPESTEEGRAGKSRRGERGEEGEAEEKRVEYGTIAGACRSCLPSADSTPRAGKPHSVSIPTRPAPADWPCYRPRNRTTPHRKHQLAQPSASRSTDASCPHCLSLPAPPLPGVLLLLLLFGGVDANSKCRRGGSGGQGRSGRREGG